MGFAEEDGRGKVLFPSQSIKGTSYRFTTVLLTFVTRVSVPGPLNSSSLPFHSVRWQEVSMCIPGSESEGYVSSLPFIHLTIYISGYSCIYLTLWVIIQ